jgi:predicted transcriptional regulator
LKVIHLIKQGNIEESIETAKKELLPFTKKGERFVKEIEKIMGLLAFMNLKECPNKDLIK